MTFMQRRRTSVKSNPGQFNFFHLLDGPLTTVPGGGEFGLNTLLINRLQHRTGWPVAVCIAYIEANGGPNYV